MGLVVFKGPPDTHTHTCAKIYTSLAGGGAEV